MALILIPVVAVFIRVLIQAAVQTGILIAVGKLIGPLTDKAKEAYASAFNLTEEEAQDTLANDVIDVMATLGILGLSIKSKLPTKVAERLGFTSKGYSKRTLSPKTQSKLANKSKPSTNIGVATSDDIAEIGKSIASSRGLSLSSVQSLGSIIFKTLGLTTGMVFAFAQYIDFANWQGPYQRKFQDLLSKLGINPDSPMPKASVVDGDIWKRIYATVEELGPLGVSFPFSGVDKPYSRQALADLVDEVAANLVKAGGQASYKNVIALVLPLVQLGGVPSSGSASSTQDLIGKQSFDGVSDVRVFTGIVSQGVLGNGLVFTPRPDDLIESMSELHSAMNNNIAPYLASLLGKIIYEIKVVPSVIIDNLTRKGTVQTIITGYHSNGLPKKKTVVNKFAVADIYIINDIGNRTRIKRIVLGPTDAVKFQPDPAKLADLSAVVSKDIVQTNTDAISTVVSNTPTQSQTPTLPAPAPTGPVFEPGRVELVLAVRMPGNYLRLEGNEIERLKGEVATGRMTYEEVVNSLASSHGPGGKFASMNSNPSDAALSIREAQSNLSSVFSGAFADLERRRSAGVSPPAPAPQSGTTPPAIASSPTQALPVAALTAPNLSAFYTALGRALPSLTDRGLLYQSYGLGQAAFYTGTAEQNTRLLQELKQRAF